MLELPSPTGITANTLAELKVIGAVESWYPRNGGLARKKKGVERRAAVLPGEYRRPLEKLDREYHGTTADQVGPLVRRLGSFGRLRGLVMGAWQEGSKGLHDLFDILTESKLNAMGLARGMQGTEMERGTILGQFRRRLSVAAAKVEPEASPHVLEVFASSTCDKWLGQKEREKNQQWHPRRNPIFPIFLPADRVS